MDVSIIAKKTLPSDMPEVTRRTLYLLRFPMEAVEGKTEDLVPRLRGVFEESGLEPYRFVFETYKVIKSNKEFFEIKIIASTSIDFEKVILEEIASW